MSGTDLPSPNNKSIQMMNQLKMPFPWKLHHMLEEAENPETGFSNIVSWLPDGKAFKIYDQETFVETIMKTYFNQSKIKSFTRQLYIYGFLKIPNGPNEGAFYHPEFVRDDKQSCFSLRRNQAGDRRRMKGASGRRGSASSNTSSSSADSSYDSTAAGPSPIPSTMTHSFCHVKAQRRSSLSDYVCGRPSMTFSNMKPMRRSSLGSGLPRPPSMGIHCPQEVHDRRNSLSDFFDHALNLLPSEGAFASLPCLDSLTARQESLGANSGNLNGFRYTSIGVFGKEDWQEPTPLKDEVSQSLMMSQYPKEDKYQNPPLVVTSPVPLPPSLPRREQCLVVTPTNSCTFSEVTFNPPVSEIETTSNPFDDDPLLDVEFLEPNLDMSMNGNMVNMMTGDVTLDRNMNMHMNMNPGPSENVNLTVNSYEVSYDHSLYRPYEQYSEYD